VIATRMRIAELHLQQHGCVFIRQHVGHKLKYSQVLSQGSNCKPRAAKPQVQVCVQEAMSRLFGPPPEPEVDPDGESFISVSVRSDMDLGTAPDAQDPTPPSSFAGCVPQILPSVNRPAALAALPARSVHKLQPGNSCLVSVPPGLDCSKDYSKLPPFSYDMVRAVFFLHFSTVSSQECIRAFDLGGSTEP
jgi:hypothetical protein